MDQLDRLTAKTISARESTSIQELNTLADRLKQYVATENDAFLQQATDQLNSQPSVWARFFPSRIQREKNRITVQSMRMLYQDKEKFFKFYSEVKLEVAKRQSNALVASVGMDLQWRLAEFANDRINRLTNTFTVNRKIFMERMLPELKDLENYRDFPELFEPAYKSTKKMITTYFDSIDTLLQGFIDSLKIKVSEVQT